MYMPRERVKNAMDTLEYLVESARSGFSCHGVDREGRYYTTVTEKKNGRKKGYYVREASIVANNVSFGNFSRGDILEFVQFYHKGDVDNFSLRITMGDADLEHEDQFKVRENTTIETWMALDDGRVMAGAYNMDNIEAALNYQTDDKIEKRFVKELNKNIFNSLKVGRDKIHEILYGK
ncbi:MAG: hypothetical protein KKA79_09050 [Nanoarchaeota archaeon]|nr:hypothetical protein [Nanoarchaeota archaeon]MCG2717935.1 hypothetical protein [Nanoarchaeota archaeon]